MVSVTCILGRISLRHTHVYTYRHKCELIMNLFSHLYRPGFSPLVLVSLAVVDIGIVAPGTQGPFKS